MFEICKVSANELVSDWGHVLIVSDWLKLKYLLKSVSMNYGTEKKGLLHFEKFKIFNQLITYF